MVAWSLEMKPEDFMASLKDSIPRIVVCAGEESFFKEEVLRVFRKVADEEGVGLSFINFEIAPGEKGEAAGSRLLRELCTPSLFKGEILFVVRSGGEVLKSLSKRLFGYLKGDSSLPNRVLFFTESLDGRTKFAKLLREAGGLVECKKLYATAAYWQRGTTDESELSRWAVRRAAARGIELSVQAACFLTAHTGNDLFRIDSELEKIALYLPAEGKKVDVEEIEKVTGVSAIHTPFDLWDKIESQDRAGALETLSMILRNGLRSVGGKLESDDAAISAILLGMFRERLRLSSQVALLMWEKKQDRAIMEELNIRSAFYLNKLKDTARRLTARSVRSINAALLDAERRIKRMGHRAVPVMEELVIKLAGAGY